MNKRYLLGFDVGSSSVKASLVDVETGGERAVVFKNVLVRANPSYALEMHVDLEEGNAAGVANGDLVELIKIG